VEFTLKCLVLACYLDFKAWNTVVDNCSFIHDIDHRQCCVQQERKESETILLEQCMLMAEIWRIRFHHHGIHSKMISPPCMLFRLQSMEYSMQVLFFRYTTQNIDCSTRAETKSNNTRRSNIIRWNLENSISSQWNSHLNV